MPWSDKIIGAFDKVKVNPSEADFLGPYNKLLYSLFPPDTDFMVVPKFIPASCESPEFLVMIEVTHHDQPILILLLNQPSSRTHCIERLDADQEVRIRLSDLRDESPFPVLYAISALGTKLCFYTQHKGQHIDPPVPPVQPGHDHFAIPPRERWSYDLLEVDGEQKFREMVQQIKRACAVP